MHTILAPALSVSREEWPDADFDLPEGDTIHAESDKEDDDDWDVEMDLGKTGGAKARAVVASLIARSGSFQPVPSPVVIRAPLPSSDDDDEEDEGASTIKVTALPTRDIRIAPPVVEENLEDAFALPSDLTQLSLRPLSLHHRSSKTSLEWGDKDQTSSSQSSDTYSSLGLADTSPSSNYTSASLPEETDEDDEEDEGELEGLVIPSGLFETKQGGKQLAKILEMKRKAPVVDERPKAASPDPEDDFEIGLVIDDADFSPSRLQNAQQLQLSKRIAISRSKSVPPHQPGAIRPPSRLKAERTKSAMNPGTGLRTTRNLTISPSPPPISFQNIYTLASAPPPSVTSFLTPRSANLRGQKSHTGLKPPSPSTGSNRKLARKASLPSLSDANNAQASGSGSGSGAGPSDRPTRYGAPTAASRARIHTNSANRIHTPDFNVPPTRPSTPSANPAALRLTMPTSSSRLKARPPISSVFPHHVPRTNSPLPPRPSSVTTTSKLSRPTYAQTVAQPPLPKVLRRPKRQRLYGDGTELDGFDDLPTDGEKESRFRVAPKPIGHRVPGGSYSFKGADKKKTKREGSDVAKSPSSSPSKQCEAVAKPVVKRKKMATSPGQTKRKPTLIRNLGGAGAPKVVGDMRWNPQMLRWEGNDQMLRDFEAAVTSARPALITHLTGSSIGSPIGSFASGARIVGNMIFDPARMCWISRLPPEQDEPDVFADLADDEEDGDGWETKGGTIRANQQSGATASSDGSADSVGRMESPSPARSNRTRSMSESESDRGSRASMVYDVDEHFLDHCRQAEERHRLEMKGWKSLRGDLLTGSSRPSLYEIRALATRQY